MNCVLVGYCSTKLSLFCLPDDRFLLLTFSSCRARPRVATRTTSSQKEREGLTFDHVVGALDDLEDIDVTVDELILPDSMHLLPLDHRLLDLFIEVSGPDAVDYLQKR